MIPTTLKHQNWEEPLSGNKPILRTQLWLESISFTWEIFKILVKL